MAGRANGSTRTTLSRSHSAAPSLSDWSYWRRSAPSAINESTEDVMPYTVQKRGRRWAIVNKATGRIAGYSRTKRRASISAGIRNRAHR